jgi:hypothetical protein
LVLLRLEIQLRLYCLYQLRQLRLEDLLQGLWDRLRLWGQYNLLHRVGPHWVLWVPLTLCCQLHQQARHWAQWDLVALLHHLLQE